MSEADTGASAGDTSEVTEMMMWGWQGMAGGGWIFMTLFWIALIVLIVWAVAALFPRGQERDSRPQETPQEVLDRRYAWGEIDTDTYQSMREDLSRWGGVSR